MKLGYGIEVEQALRLVEIACDRAALKCKIGSARYEILDALSYELRKIIMEDPDKGQEEKYTNG